MEPRPRSKKEMVLRVTAASGELSPVALTRLVPSKEYRYKVLQKLQQQNLINTCTRDGVKGYRLTAHSKKRLLEAEPERYKALFTGSTQTNTYQTELPKRLRQQRISEVLVLMERNGIPYHADEKPPLFQPDGSGSEIIAPAFYLAREIQTMGDAAIKIRGARMVGVLLTEGGSNLVYNTGPGLMRWAQASETRAKFLLGEYLGRHLGLAHRIPAEPSAILLGHDVTQAAAVLQSNGGYKHRFLSMDGTFAHVYFLPNDDNGDFLLQLQCRPAVHHKLAQAMLTTVHPKIYGNNFEYDAVSDDRQPVLFGWDFDLQRYQNFLVGIRARALRGCVIAFDFQADTLHSYFGDDAVIRTLSLTKTKGMLFPNGYS